MSTSFNAQGRHDILTHSHAGRTHDKSYTRKTSHKLNYVRLSPGGLLGLGRVPPTNQDLMYFILYLVGSWSGCAPITHNRLIYNRPKSGNGINSNQQ